MRDTAGDAKIKPEYIISLEPTQSADDDLAEGSTSHVGRSSTQDPATAAGTGGRTRLTKAEKKAFRGANKGSDRRYTKVRDQGELCWKIAVGEPCERGDHCRFSHEIQPYLDSKEPDVAIRQEMGDPTPICPEYTETGRCRFGYKCRFLSAHTSPRAEGEVGLPRLLYDTSTQKHNSLHAQELNFIDITILKELRSKRYKTPISEAYVESIGDHDRRSKPSTSITSGSVQKGGEVLMAEPEQEDEPMTTAPTQLSDTAEKRTGIDTAGPDVDTPDVAPRFVEKKRLHWQDKTYLAPLTTVGNLPFRRLCVSYGCDITCGEMALATSLLSGSKEEWSLLRRHPSERIFGVQVAGNRPGTLASVSEVIGKECGSGIDFVDLNCGCPIDLVFKAGSGSALLDMAGKLTKCVVGMNTAIGDIPVTVKLRTGVKDGNNNAHKLMPRLDSEAGAASLTLHGRTRQQRYTKLADWKYIKTCVSAVREREEEEDLPRIPIFGGGDCYSSQEYQEHQEESGVDGVMLARGALIKPWIFTEVKERREWDISSRERLDGIRQYAECAISHFGSDTAGINTSRRYLCEALSFQYRYIPIGILETLPGRINDRAPSFRCRDELETLLASPKSSDWVKVSEMFLGPAPETFRFTPKHKSNSYESQG